MERQFVKDTDMVQKNAMSLNVVSTMEYVNHKWVVDHVLKEMVR